MQLLTSVAPQVRTIYREIAFAEGRTGYTNVHEWV